MEFKTKNDYDLIISKIQELVSMFETHSTRNNKYKFLANNHKKLFAFFIVDNF